MKRVFKPAKVLILLLFISTGLFAQKFELTLSEESEISLLTCSPGNDLYSVFGHSAIRVNDPKNNIDWVFNYGTFDFSDPNFYVNFIKGRLNYFLSVQEYPYFEASYKHENRWIWEKPINITPFEKQELFDSLLINYTPAYRFYLYDFFFDNCATRIRDILTESFESEVEFDYTRLESSLSFRKLLMPYLTEKPWAKLGINLALGKSADNIASPWEYMFLPDHMMTAFEDAKFTNINSLIPFTTSTNIILEGEELKRSLFRNSPFWLLTGLLLFSIFISIRDYKFHRISRWFDITIFLIPGLVGILIVFLWFFSDHHVTNNNFNLFWAHPLQLSVLFLSTFRKINLKNIFYKVNLVLSVLFLVFWHLIPQSLPIDIAPFLLVMIVRSVTNINYGKSMIK